jgi:biopolymer transport protein ExbD
MKLRRARKPGHGRIEIIPMIDVMFFLLVTFMLASLSMQNLHSLRVNLPKGHAAPMHAHKGPVTLTITKDSKLEIDDTPVTLDTLAGVLKPRLQGGDASVVVNADAEAPHGIVTEAMLRAQQAGASHFMIAVKHVD